MSMYHEGYSKAREEVSNMSESELLEYIDGMYGTDNLPLDYTFDDLRTEALDQCRRDFTDTSSKEYEQVQFYTKLHKAMKSK